MRQRTVVFAGYRSSRVKSFFFKLYLRVWWNSEFTCDVFLWRIHLKPGVGNHPVITCAYLSQVDQIA